MTRKITIYTGKSRKSSLWACEALGWEELRERLLAFRVTGETLDEYLRMSRERQTDVKDVGGYVAGILRDGIRKKANMELRSMITLDYDSWDASLMESLREKFPGVCWLVHSTHKHRPEAQRVRVVMPLSRDLDPETYEAVARMVAATIGMSGIDRTTFEPSRMMFFPSRPVDAEYVADSNDADDYLDPDRVLELYADDWQDPKYWPRTDDEENLFKLAGCGNQDPRALEIWSRYANAGGKGTDKGSGMEDPTKKKGIVGAFCRSFSISQAIATFLPNVYTPYRNGRYTYAAGTTHGGAVTYQDTWLYSNHATDPIQGREVNAFDLVRLHLYGSQDTGSRVKDVTRLPSFEAMTRMAAQRPEVRRELAREAAERGRDAFADITLPTDTSDTSATSDTSGPSWDDIYAGCLDRKGNFDPVSDNIMKVLLYHPDLRGKLRYNSFTGRLEITGTPFGTRRDDKNSQFGDNDRAAVRRWLERCYGVKSVKSVDDALCGVEDMSKYHPVLDYLDSLEWDGVPRLAGLFTVTLGAEDTELNRWLAKALLVSAVARVNAPGVKYDLCITLYGPEGCGKSTLLSKLAGEWFSDSPLPIGNKDAMINIRGVLIYEVGEMSSINNADLDTVKNFLTSTHDKYRSPYGRDTVSVPRQTVFTATTNDRYCLRGYGDNRRFPVVTCVPANIKVKSWDYVDRWRDQLWAEAVTLYRDGFRLYMPDEIAKAALAKAKEHNFDISDPMFEVIDEYLEKPLPDDWPRLTRAQRKQFIQGTMFIADASEPRTQVCLKELLTECMDLREGSREYSSAGRMIAKYMDKCHPEWKKVGHIPTDAIYGRGKGWVKEVGRDESYDIV